MTQTLEFIFNLNKGFREMLIKNLRKIMGVLQQKQLPILVSFNSPLELISFFKNLIAFGSNFKADRNSQILLAQDLLLYSKCLRTTLNTFYRKNTFNININLNLDNEETKKHNNQEVLNWIGAIMRRIEVQELIISFQIDSQTKYKIENIQKMHKRTNYLTIRIQWTLFDFGLSMYSERYIGEQERFQVHFTQSESDYTSTILYLVRGQEVKRTLIFDTDSDEESSIISKIKRKLRALNYDRFELHTANSHYRQQLHLLPFDSAHKEVYFDYLNSLPKDVYKQKTMAWDSIKDCDNKSALNLDELEDSDNIRILKYIIKNKENIVFDGSGNAQIDSTNISPHTFQKLLSLTLVTEITLNNFSLLNIILSKIKLLKTLECRNLIQCPINIHLEEHTLKNLRLDMVYYSQQIIEDFVERNCGQTLRKLQISGIERDQRIKNSYNLNWILSRFTFMASHKKFKAWKYITELDISIKIKPLHLDIPLQKDGIFEFIKSMQVTKLKSLALDLPFDSDQLQLKKGPKTQWIKDYLCVELLKISSLKYLTLSSPIKQKANIIKNGLKWEVDQLFQIDLLRTIVKQGNQLQSFTIKGKNSFKIGREIMETIKHRIKPLKLSFEYPQVTDSLVNDLVEFSSNCPQHQLSFITPSEFDF